MQDLTPPTYEAFKDIARRRIDHAPSAIRKKLFNMPVSTTFDRFSLGFPTYWMLSFYPTFERERLIKHLRKFGHVYPGLITTDPAVRSFIRVERSFGFSVSHLRLQLEPGDAAILLGRDSTIALREVDLHTVPRSNIHFTCIVSGGDMINEYNVDEYMEDIIVANIASFMIHSSMNEEM